MTDDQGVPEDLLEGDNFMRVSSGLVALLKSANAALVWARIDFRQKHVNYSHAHGGRAWWEVTEADLGADVGLSREAAGRALDKLVAGGYLLAEQHNLPMQTFSYSTVRQSSKSRIGKGDIAPSNARNRTLQDAKSPIAPIYQEVEEEVQEEASRADGGDCSPELRALADRIAVMVRANGHPVGVVGKVWWQPLDRLVRIDGFSLEQIEIVAKWATSDEFWASNIRSTSKLRKQFSTLRAQRNTALSRKRVAPIERAQSVIEMGQRMQTDADRKAVRA